MVIFAIIFLYIVFSVYTYLTRDQVKFYEVLKGSIVKETGYTGLALRTEETVAAPSSGYVNYYIQEGHRAAVGSKVCTIDETGSLQSYLAEHPELSGALSDEQLRELRSKLSSFSMNYADRDFSKLYDAKYALDAAALEYASVSSTQDLDAVLAELGISYTQVSAEKSGVVSYAVDGMESLTDSAVTKDLFETTAYKKTITKPGAAVEAGSPIYKLITDSNWSLIFPATDAFKEQYQDIHTIQIRFAENDIETQAALSIYTAQDGNNYGKITLDRYLEDFCSDRYVDFEILVDDQIGLKIPATAVATKDFYLIPKDFKAEENGAVGFYRQVVAEGGTSTEFVETSIYREDDQYCYIAIPDANEQTNAIKAGDFLSKQDTAQTYQVGATGKVEGVYNINKGYAVFRQIVRMEENNEYIIAAQGTPYGISVYDHIVLDASTVYEGELIYQ